MKKCPGCGKSCNDTDVFCESCGSRLSDESEQQVDHKSNAVPIVIGCVIAAALLIGGTFFFVSVLRGKSEDSVQESVKAERDLAEEPGGKENSEGSEDSEGKEDSKGEADQETDESRETGESEEADGQSEADADSAGEPARLNEGDDDMDLPASPAEVTTGTVSPEVSQGESESDQTKYETYYVVNCHESITLRKTASTKGKEICQIPFGAAVSYVETAENGFYKIIYNGKTGYGLASYLATAPQEKPASSSNSSSSGVLMRVVNCHESITLRKIPSTKGEEFCQIPLGATVEFLSTAENGFYMVSYNGYTGYALASYLKEC